MSEQKKSLAFNFDFFEFFFKMAKKARKSSAYTTGNKKSLHNETAIQTVRSLLQLRPVSKLKSFSVSAAKSIHKLKRNSSRKNERSSRKNERSSRKNERSSRKNEKSLRKMKQKSSRKNEKSSRKIEAKSFRKAEPKSSRKISQKSSRKIEQKSSRKINQKSSRKVSQKSFRKVETKSCGYQTNYSRRKFSWKLLGLSLMLFIIISAVILVFIFAETCKGM